MSRRNCGSNNSKSMKAFRTLILSLGALLPMTALASATGGSAHTAPSAAPSAASAVATPPARPFLAQASADPADVQPDSTSQNLRLIVGHSIFLKTTERLHRIYVSDPEMLQSFTASPNQVVLTAKNPGVSSVALWDSTGHSLLYTVSSDLDVTALRRSLQLALPGQDVQVRAQGGRVYLSGTVVGDGSYKEAATLAGMYSKDVVNSLLITYAHLKQVKLKVRIAEVDRTKLAQFGFNFFTTGPNSNTSAISTQQFSSIGLLPGAGPGGSSLLEASSPLNLFLYNSKLNIGATIADLEAHNVLQILAEPTITSISGHEASFLSGGEFPYPVIQGGAGNFASVTIMFQPYGVKLKFTPDVNPDGTILLKVAPEVSALDYTNAVTISGYTVPAISTRRAETEVELRDGESFSISGLLDHRTTVLLSKVPGISNVPILGQLFRSKNNTHSVEELVVIVTATLVDPLHETPHPVTPKMSIPNMSKSAFDNATPPKLKQPPQ